MHYLSFDTWGWVATSALILCAVSGVLLAVPYDVINPYLSVTRLVTANPAASYVRNIHYWSAQLFLILTIIHIFDHLLFVYENRVRKKGVWLRLSISVIFVFYVMISGFILKADGDSLQAQRILESLIGSLPFVGSLLTETFVGQSGNFQLLYIHHVSTATIIVFIVVIEHVRSLNVSTNTFIITTAIIAGLSILFRAPVNELNSDMMKGPWYFIGLQEILHWLPNPVYLTIGLLLLPLLLYLVFFMTARLKQTTVGVFLFLLVIYGLLTITGLFFRGPMWQWQWPWQDDYRTTRLLTPDRLFFGEVNPDSLRVLNGRVEGCMGCHAGMTGFSEAHKPEYIGCYSCHGGDPLTLNKTLAHKNMYPVPGNLSNAAMSCGKVGCHPSITERVPISLMASLSGIISVDRWIFGENSLPTGDATIRDIGNKTAADIHLRNLCAGCHLGSEKLTPGPPEWLDRGGGCLACHLSYDERALSALNLLKNGVFNIEAPSFHPAIGLEINNDHCKSCHSRSGRISMNYEGWHETILKPEDAEGKHDLKLFPDQRVFSKQVPDVHHKAGMLCIDCHGSYELMGDGNIYMHKEDAVKVQCDDCHTQKVKRQAKIEDTDQESRLIAWLRNYKVEDVNVVLTQKSGHVLINTRVEENGNLLKMIKKSDGSLVLMKPPAKACSAGKAHNRLSCDACHTGWAPQCIGCHNSYEPNTEGFDMLNKKSRKGTWVEFLSEGLAELPVLGVNESDIAIKGGRVTTFIPGMIMTLDKEAFKKGSGHVFHRLYAPASAHTTQRVGRSCESCHNSSLAIGYGRGSMKFSAQGKWIFDAQYANNKNDGLPEDAWTGFLKERREPASTRIGMRPFNIKEQKRILTAGACLTCHKSNSVVMNDALIDFDKVIERKAKQCILPIW